LADVPLVFVLKPVCDQLLVRLEANMRRLLLQTTVVVALAAIATVAIAQNRPTRFWNLTRNTITELHLAPAGTSDWGPDQCKNDKDGTVETDERLRVTGVPSGNYDVKLADVTGRVCIVRGVKIEAGGIFSIEEKDLTSCQR
jgi:hypothetical protein